MHGWAEIYLPGGGWIGFDPSWGLLATSNYFPVAVSRHSEHAPPISGTYLGTPRSFLRSQVDLHVMRIDELLPPRLSLEGKEPVDFLAGGDLLLHKSAPSISSQRQG